MNNCEKIREILEYINEKLLDGKFKGEDSFKIGKMILDILLEGSGIKRRKFEKILKEKFIITNTDYHINESLYLFSKEENLPPFPPQGKVFISNFNLAYVLLKDLNDLLRERIGFSLIPKKLIKILEYKGEIERVSVYLLDSKEPYMVFYTIAQELSHVILYEMYGNLLPDPIDEMLSTAISSECPKRTLEYYERMRIIIERYREVYKYPVEIGYLEYRILGVALSSKFSRKIIWSMVKKIKKFLYELEPWRFSVLNKNRKIPDIYRSAKEWISKRINASNYF